MTTADNTSGVAREPAPPLFLIDDDDWMNIYDSVDSMLDDLEWPWVGEIAHVFDSAGRQLKLSVDNESIRIDSIGSIALSQAEKAIDRFFEKWTHDISPSRSSSSDRYFAAVHESYVAARFRRKRRR